MKIIFFSRFNLYWSVNPFILYLLGLEVCGMIIFILFFFFFQFPLFKANHECCEQIPTSSEFAMIHTVLSGYLYGGARHWLVNESLPASRLGFALAAHKKVRFCQHMVRWFLLGTLRLFNYCWIRSKICVCWTTILYLNKDVKFIWKNDLKWIN